MEYFDTVIGDELAKAYNDGYEQGKKDAVKWINCAKKLPEETGRYLVCDRLDERVRIEYFYASCNLGWAGAQAYKITHWMPLPPMPEGGLKHG